MLKLGPAGVFPSLLTRPSEARVSDDQPVQNRITRVGNWRGQLQSREADKTADANSPRELLCTKALLSHQTTFVLYKTLASPYW